MTILMIPDHNFDNPLSEVGQKMITIVTIPTKILTVTNDNLSIHLSKVIILTIPKHDAQKC